MICIYIYTRFETDSSSITCLKAYKYLTVAEVVQSNPMTWRKACVYIVLVIVLCGSIQGASGAKVGRTSSQTWTTTSAVDNNGTDSVEGEWSTTVIWTLVAVGVLSILKFVFGVVNRALWWLCGLYGQGFSTCTRGVHKEAVDSVDCHTGEILGFVGVTGVNSAQAGLSKVIVTGKKVHSHRGCTKLNDSQVIFRLEGKCKTCEEEVTKASERTGLRRRLSGD